MTFWPSGVLICSRFLHTGEFFQSTVASCLLCGPSCLFGFIFFSLSVQNGLRCIVMWCSAVQRKINWLIDLLIGCSFLLKGYLQEEGLSATSQAFIHESPSLKEYADHTTGDGTIPACMFVSHQSAPLYAYNLFLFLRFFLSKCALGINIAFYFFGHTVCLWEKSHNDFEWVCRYQIKRWGCRLLLLVLHLLLLLLFSSYLFWFHRVSSRDPCGHDFPVEEAGFHPQSDKVMHPLLQTVNITDDWQTLIGSLFKHSVYFLQPGHCRTQMLLHQVREVSLFHFLCYFLLMCCSQWILIFSLCLCGTCDSVCISSVAL